MFTGLIEATAKVLECSEQGIMIERPAFFDDIKVGSSIAVSGACLTVAELTSDSMKFDVHEETWKRTKMGELKKGDYVNLERALKAGDRLGGHIVQGHVDTVARVCLPKADRPREVEMKVAARVPSGTPAPPTLTIEYPEHLRGLIVEKGSIAVDGVSLTITHVDDEMFSVALIPTTLKETTLGELKEGDRVNLEADVLGRYARRGIIKV